MKLILYYFCSLALAWMGIHSILVGLAYWETTDGSLMPIVAGFLLVILASAFIVRTIRMFVPPEKEQGHGLTD